jgi:two-component system CheB/CheR fusion protein
MQRFMTTPWGKYVVALAATGAALLARGLLDPMVGHNSTTTALLYGAIVLSVWAGGYRPGIVSAVLGYVGANYFFMAPTGGLSLSAPGDVGRLIGYVISAAFIIALGGAMHAARRRAESVAERAQRHAAELEREVAQHRETQEKLEGREGDLHVITDTMSVAVARCSRDMRYLWVNRLYAEWAGNGKTPQEMIGKPMIDILGGETMARIRPHIEDVLAGRRVEYERFARRPLGRRWIQAILEPTFDEGGSEVNGWVAVIQDIDDRKRAAEALRGTQEELQLITDNMPAAVCRTGNDLRYMWMNPTYARWLGRPWKEVVGQPVADIIGPAQMREIAPHIARVLKGEQVQYERLVDLPGLGRRWVAGVFSPILDASGTPDGWVTILTDIHDRRMAEDALREADRRKDDFLATLAHELRNPLAPIKNAVAILGRKGSLDPELSWGREVIARQVEQMSRLVDDLLDIERISRGKFLVRKERIDLERAIDMALEMSRPYINAAGHRLSVLMPSERVMLDADPVRLSQVFSNLLNNAAKFTEPQGSISLTATSDGSVATISIEDSGVGFEPDTAARLFRPYAQGGGAPHARDSASRPSAGLGIGLSLVQGIVTLHGGTVEARSAGHGKGAEFIVRLPLAGLERRAKSRDAASPAPALSAPPGFRVLIADDNQDAADSLQRILEHFGYEVRVAYDGTAAAEAGRDFAPKVAILDIGMPGSNGYEVANGLRAQYGKDVTLIALTGWGQEGDRRRALEAGFDRHLTKPVDPGVLHALLKEMAEDDESSEGDASAGGGKAAGKRS